MSNPNNASFSTKVRVGVFSLLGLLLLGAMTVFVNDKPYWWRGCELVYLSIEDATGLRYKSPVKSLGLQIGYIKSVQLNSDHVRLGVCVTAPIEVTSETKASIRGEGFLGDKFVELKPVRPLDSSAKATKKEGSTSLNIKVRRLRDHALYFFLSQVSTPAMAEEEAKPKEIPVESSGQDVQKLMEKVNGLVTEVTGLASSIREGINPADLKKTVQQLNKTLENASKTLSPEGGLTTTARRTLSKLEDSVDQLRQVMTRINEGKGSLGMLINDPIYAEELKKAAKNLNILLNKVSYVRFFVNVGAEKIAADVGTRGWIQLSIWPSETRYYLLGLTSDPRGKISSTTTTTEVGSTSTTVKTTQTEKGGFVLTALLGKRFFNQRLDGSVGIFHGDGTVRLGLNLWTSEEPDRLQWMNDTYGRTYAESGETVTRLDWRPSLIFYPWKTVYVKGGVDSVRKVDGKMPYFVGVGLSFEDEDIKLLFSFL